MASRSAFRRGQDARLRDVTGYVAWAVKVGLRLSALLGKEISKGQHRGCSLAETVLKGFVHRTHRLSLFLRWARRRR